MFCAKKALLHSRSRSQRRFKMLVSVCPGNIFWTTEHFVAKPGMVMQHCKLECHAEKLVTCVQCQGHSEGLYNKDITISVVSSKLLVSLQPNFVWLYSIICWSVLWKKGITVFKVKVKSKVQNVSACLFWWYFLYVSDHICSVYRELLNHFFFFTKLGMVVYYHEAMCLAENWFTIFNVEVTMRAYIIKIWLLLLYLLNCCSICNQTWFDSTAS